MDDLTLYPSPDPASVVPAPPPRRVPRGRRYLFALAAVLVLALSVTVGIVSGTAAGRTVAASQLYRTAVTNSVKSDNDDVAASASIVWNQGTCTFEQDGVADQQQLTCTTPADHQGAPYLITDRYVYAIGGGRASTYYEVLGVRAAPGSSLTTAQLRAGYSPVLGRWEAYNSSPTRATWFGMGPRDLVEDGPLAVLAGVQHIFQAAYFDEAYAAAAQRAYLKVLDTNDPFVGRAIARNVDYRGLDGLTRVTVSVTRAAYRAFEARLSAGLPSSAGYVADSASFDDRVFGSAGVLTAQVYLDAEQRIAGVTVDMPFSSPVQEQAYGTTMSRARSDYATLYGEDNAIDVPPSDRALSKQEWESRLTAGLDAMPTGS
jgi:hypothetical protein